VLGYASRRLLLFVPTLFGVTVSIFVLLRVIPGDVAEILASESGAETAATVKANVDAIRRELRLDQPVVTQYVEWLRRFLAGDLGYSYWERRPVSEIVGERLPRSLELSVLTLVLALAWAIPLGVVSAVRQNRWIDYVVRCLSILGMSLPLFLTGVLVLYVLTHFFRWMPPLDFREFSDAPLVNLQQLIWPAAAQAAYISAPISRLTRAQMLDVIREDYIRTARAKGVREWVITYSHAFRNALLPVVTFVGWWGGRLLGGVVVMEIVFGVPGMGTTLVDAINHRDYPTVQAIVLIMTLVFLGLNLFIDLLYGWLDPRIRYA
jgi:peptide/nickel transport system permease protein